MGLVGVNGSDSSFIAAAARLTCLPGPFCDARCLFEEVRHCRLADFQVIGSVKLRRQESGDIYADFKGILMSGRRREQRGFYKYRAQHHSESL